MPPLGSLALQRMGLQWLQRLQELEDNASINVLGEAVVGAHRNKQHQRRRNGAHGKDTLMSKNERRVRLSDRVSFQRHDDAIIRPPSPPAPRPVDQSYHTAVHVHVRVVDLPLLAL